MGPILYSTGITITPSYNSAILYLFDIGFLINKDPEKAPDFTFLLITILLGGLFVGIISISVSVQNKTNQKREVNLKILEFQKINSLDDINWENQQDNKR